VLSAKARPRAVVEGMERIAFAGTSIKQYGTAEQLADYVVYLASRRAGTISWQALAVCSDTDLMS